MNEFQVLFEKSNDKPIIYNNKKLFLADYVTFTKNTEVRVSIVSAKKNRTQIFSLSVDTPPHKKALSVNGKKVKGILFHKDIMPQEGVKITILEDCIIKISTRGSFTFFWPMVLEEKENKRIYSCNGDDPDNTFSDLVFEIEILK